MASAEETPSVPAASVDILNASFSGFSVGVPVSHTRKKTASRTLGSPGSKGCKVLLLSSLPAFIVLTNCVFARFELAVEDSACS